jgi:hypothetical protein
MMKIGPAVAAAAVFAIASPLCAQDAVQWRVEDGGNGHWYGRLAGTYPFDHSAISTAAQAIGAHLVALSSASEEQYVLQRLGAGLLGLRAAQGSASFQWTNGEPLNYTNWGTSSCFSGPYPNNGSGQQRFVFQSHPECAGSQGFAPSWDDYYPSELGSGIAEPAVEWSADCNGDGVVDYGQIRDGTFPDVNANGVPDCCDQAESCTPCPGDVTNGGTVDAADLSILLAAWGTNGQGEFDTDLNGDGLVDGGDLALVLGGWGACP